MEVEKHPDIDQLKAHADQEWIKEHVANCERCKAIMEGLELLKQESANQGQPLDQLLSNSRDQTWSVIDRTLPKLRVSKTLWYGSAAFVLLVLVGSWVLIMNKRSAEEFDPNAPHPATSFRSAVTESSREFVTHYRNEDYEEARRVLQKEAPNGENIFFTGLTFLYQSMPNPDSAIQYFNSLEVQQSLYSENAEYYVTIARLMRGDTVQAVQQLESIENKTYHSNRAEAKTLLESLQR